MIEDFCNKAEEGMNTLWYSFILFKKMSQVSLVYG